MRIAMTAAALAAVVALAPLGVQAQQSQPVGSSPWVHVRVVDTDDNDERMAINLPLAVVELMLRVVPAQVMEQGRAELKDLPAGLRLSDVRALWRQLAAAGDAELVSMRHEDQTIHVARRGDQIQVRMTDDDGDQAMSVDVPARVVDALLSGDGEDLNIDAAITELRTIRGDLVNLRGNDEHEVRVWIDESAS
jgi:hypothetical protein